MKACQAIRLLVRVVHREGSLMIDIVADNQRRCLEGTSECLSV